MFLFSKGKCWFIYIIIARIMRHSVGKQKLSSAGEKSRRGMQSMSMHESYLHTTSTCHWFRGSERWSREPELRVGSREEVFGKLDKKKNLRGKDLKSKEKAVVITDGQRNPYKQFHIFRYLFKFPPSRFSNSLLVQLFITAGRTTYLFILFIDAYRGVQRKGGRILNIEYTLIFVKSLTKCPKKGGQRTVAPTLCTPMDA